MELLGIDPVRVAGGLARGLVGLALAPLEQITALRRDRREVWSCPGRLHIEAHGVHGPRGKQVAERIERALEGRPGVLWARVNAPSARVVVAVEESAPATDDLVVLVRRAEADPATEDERLVEDELHHPADGLKGTRLLPTPAADAAGLAPAAITRIAPTPPRRWPRPSCTAWPRAAKARCSTSPNACGSGVRCGRTSGRGAPPRRT